jgi:ribosomal protein S18 acetylase RimI-like enzyme
MSNQGVKRIAFPLAIQNNSLRKR